MLVLLDRSKLSLCLTGQLANLQSQLPVGLLDGIIICILRHAKQLIELIIIHGTTRRASSEATTKGICTRNTSEKHPAACAAKLGLFSIFLSCKNLKRRCCIKQQVNTLAENGVRGRCSLNLVQSGSLCSVGALCSSILLNRAAGKRHDDGSSYRSGVWSSSRLRESL